MAAETTVEGVYATALLEAAQEKGDLDQVKEELEAIIPALLDERRIFDFLCTPNISRPDKIKVLKKVFGGKTSDTVLNFLLMVIRRGRQTSLRPIHSKFIDLYRSAKNLLVVDVKTATKLQAKQRKRLVEVLGKRYGREVVLREQVDAGLIGGLELRAEGEEVDASLRFRLRQVSSRLRRGKLKSGEFHED